MIDDGDNAWYDDDDFLIPYNSLPNFLMEALFMLDSQVFGLVVAFPYAFTCGTLASALIILIVIQITLKTIIVAICSFLAANIAAYLCGSRLGWRLEQWHLYLLLEHGKLKNRNNTKYQSQSTSENENILVEDNENSNSNQSRIRPILRKRKRNWYFKMTFVVIIIIANILGMIIGGLCASNLPSRLRNNTDPWVDDYYEK